VKGSQTRVPEIKPKTGEGKGRERPEGNEPLWKGRVHFGRDAKKDIFSRRRKG